MVNLNLQTPDCNHKSSNKAIESKICAERYWCHPWLQGVEGIQNARAILKLGSTADTDILIDRHQFQPLHTTPLMNAMPLGFCT